jgi:uncharacterized membrane protein YidH (DUF202 family)
LTSTGGTQPERTTLAWTRTSLAVLANGAILLLQRTHGDVGPLRFVAAGIAALLAVAAYLIGFRRQRILAQRPLPDRISPRREVYLTGGAVITLILISALALTI